MPLAIFIKFVLGAPMSISMRVLMMHQSIKYLVGILYDDFVWVDKIIFFIVFVILDCEIDYRVPIIISRPFLSIRRELVNLEYNEIKF